MKQIKKTVRVVTTVVALAVLTMGIPQAAEAVMFRNADAMEKLHMYFVHPLLSKLAGIRRTDCGFSRVI